MDADIVFEKHIRLCNTKEYCDTITVSNRLLRGRLASKFRSLMKVRGNVKCGHGAPAFSRFFSCHVMSCVIIA